MTTYLHRTGRSEASIPELIVSIDDVWFTGLQPRRKIVTTDNDADLRDVHKGDRFAWRGPHGSSYGADIADVYIIVNRVAKDGSWVDIRCYTWAVSWGKRWTLPLPSGIVPCEWSQEDLDKQEQAWQSQQKKK